MSHPLMEPPGAGDPFFPPPAKRGRPPAAEGLPPRLLDRLPALYRAETGAFSPLLEAILLSLEGLGEEARAMARAAGAPLDRPGGCRPPPDLPGTPRGLLEFLAQDGPPPVIFSGMAARPAGATGELEMVEGEAPSAVIAWPAGTEPSRSDPGRIPGELIPPGVELHVVRLAGSPPGGIVSGERFAGELLS